MTERAQQTIFVADRFGESVPDIPPANPVLTEPAARAPQCTRRRRAPRIRRSADALGHRIAEPPRRRYEAIELARRCRDSKEAAARPAPACAPATRSGAAYSR